VEATWFGLIVLMSVAVAFRHEALRLLAPPSYDGAARVIPVVVIGLALFSFYPVAEISLQIRGRTGPIPLVNGSAAALNLALNFLLIPKMHILGAAWATAIAYGAQLAGILWLGQRSFASRPFDGCSPAPPPPGRRRLGGDRCLARSRTPLPALAIPVAPRPPAPVRGRTSSSERLR
jgi:Na+-driven multidrug efflux pump